MNLDNANNDWGLRWSWSHDSSATWSTPAWINSNVDSNEVLPSIAVNDAFGSTYYTPYVTFLKCYYDWTGEISVRSFYWDVSDSSWTADSNYADSGAIVTRPIQTFTIGGGPAIAYVGENAENVYFDSWANSSGIEEEDVEADEKISCSLDSPIIMGTGTLKYNMPDAGDVKISMFNALGQEIATLYEGTAESGENTLTVSTDNLPQGVYYILVNTSTATGSAKVTVLK